MRLMLAHRPDDLGAGRRLHAATGELPSDVGLTGGRRFQKDLATLVGILTSGGDSSQQPAGKGLATLATDATAIAAD